MGGLAHSVVACDKDGVGFCALKFLVVSFTSGKSEDLVSSGTFLSRFTDADM